MQALLVLLTLNTRLFRNVFDGVDDALAVRRLNAETNNMGFIALHLLDARYYLARYLGVEITHPYAEQLDAVQHIDQMETYPPLEDLMALWEEIAAVLEARLQALTEQDLSRTSPQTFPVDDPTVLGGIAFLLEHESYHLGQLALLRKSFGLGAMRYR